MHIGMFEADARQKAVFAAFAAEHLEVEWIRELDGVKKYDFTVLPMPISADDTTVFENGLPLERVFSALSGRRVYGGRANDAVRRLAAARDVRLYDDFTREEMTVLNVIPTVEGALQIAMEQTDHTLHGSHILVCGFGRIGKLLAARLHALGAFVTVSARKESDLAWCTAYGYNSVPHGALRGVLPEQDIIFSTVPARVFDAALLARVPPATLMIDLASAPGSIDFGKAQSYGIRALAALALPGKVAPRTAGEIICKTILNMYKEEDTYGG